MEISPQKKAERFVSVLRHCQLLGLTVVQATELKVQLKLPYNEKIIGNPTLGVIHGGALTTLMDTACGTACFVAVEGMELCPTLDLRVDYMKTPETGRNLIAFASVTRIANNVIFTECHVKEENTDVLIARCNAAFMRIGPEMTPPDFQHVIKTGDTSIYLGGQV